MCTKSQAPLPQVISYHTIFSYYYCFTLNIANPHFLFLAAKLILRHIVWAHWPVKHSYNTSDSLEALEEMLLKEMGNAQWLIALRLIQLIHWLYIESSFLLKQHIFPNVHNKSTILNNYKFSHDWLRTSPIVPRHEQWNQQLSVYHTLMLCDMAQLGWSVWANAWYWSVNWLDWLIRHRPVATGKEEIRHWAQKAHTSYQTGWCGALYSCFWCNKL